MKLYDIISPDFCRVRNVKISVTQEDIDEATTQRQSNKRRLVPLADYCQHCVLARAINRITGLDEASVGFDTADVAGWDTKAGEITHWAMDLPTKVRNKIVQWDSYNPITPFTFTLVGFNLLCSTAAAEKLLGTRIGGAR